MKSGKLSQICEMKENGNINSEQESALGLCFS